MRSAVIVLRDAINILMDRSLSEEIIEQIHVVVFTEPRVKGGHRLRSALEPAGREQSGGVHIARQQSIDLRDIRQSGEVDWQQVGGEITQFQVDRRELDVHCRFVGLGLAGQ